MAVKLRSILLKDFKAYHEEQIINLSDINIFMGANSSGKSTGIQGVLGLKQTYESKQSHIGLLLTGKYATLGSFKDVLYNNKQKGEDPLFAIGVSLFDSADEDDMENLDIKWIYQNNSQLINGVELKRLELKADQNKMRLELEKDSEYSLYIKNKKIPINVVMKNMFIDAVVVGFDIEYNNYLAALLREIIDWIMNTTKHTITIDKDDLVINQVDRIARLLMLGYDFDQKGSRSKSRISKIINIVSEVEKKFRLQDSSISDNFLLGNIFPIVLDTASPVEKLEAIWKKYKDISPKQINQNKGITKIPLAKYLQQRELGKNPDIDFYLFQKYNEYVKTSLSHIRYLGPLREMPKSLYSWNIDVDPEYVGSKGEYFPSVLSTLEHKKIKTIIPGNSEIELCDFYEALYLWCQYLNVANEIHVNSEYSFGMNIEVYNVHANKADIINVGVGTSQVIPVLIMGLISPENSLIIYEQPELHLHPFSQSRLADFFVAMSKLGKQFIIETHSEYMLHRFRYHLIKESVNESKIKLNFFSNGNNGTEVREGALGQDGSIDYPDDFVDQNQSLFKEILNLAKRE